jgi:hypothetical protein
MTDYAEEQKNEIEALQSIYPEEIESKSILPTSSSIHQTSFMIIILQIYEVSENFIY